MEHISGPVSRVIADVEKKRNVQGFDNLSQEQAANMLEAVSKSLQDIGEYKKEKCRACDGHGWVMKKRNKT